MSAAMTPEAVKREVNHRRTLAGNVQSKDDAIGKMTISRSNVFILGQMLKGEAEKEMQHIASTTGLPVVAMSKPGIAETGAEGLPARQLLSAMYHIERHKRLGEVAIFAVLFAVFVAIAFQLYDVGGEIARCMRDEGSMVMRAARIHAEHMHLWRAGPWLLAQASVARYLKPLISP